MHRHGHVVDGNGHVVDGHGHVVDGYVFVCDTVVVICSIAWDYDMTTFFCALTWTC